jgi:Cu+-exporting ATPase
MIKIIPNLDAHQDYRPLLPIVCAKFRVLATTTENTLACAHCGESCLSAQIKIEEKIFCCDGCKTVYGILNEHGLCDYYALNAQPGLNQRQSKRVDKFLFLDDASIRQQLISFSEKEHTQVCFYLPQIHCSSCLYLLENLHKIDAGVIKARVNFPRKEVTIDFNESRISLRRVAELLTIIGYEPYISLNQLQQKRPATDRALIYQLGVAGFCFSNIMLLAFPEYLGIEKADGMLLQAFRWISFLLAIPVLLYSAQPFYVSAYKSLQQKYLNIDAPIVLAVLVTFIRSVYEVLSGTGSGYFDSMTGIVFFMLVGRVLQQRTYQQLSFERDYTSYFPVAVSVMKDEQETPTALPDIKHGDTLLIHHEELIPADGIITRGKAYVDYSFVTGESQPVPKEMGEIVYAGGKQTGGNMEILVIKEVAQSYLTRLWNNQSDTKTAAEKKSFVHVLSRYFTYIVFTLATLSAWYWWVYDSSRIWPAVTAVLIIACPCALLLSNSFTNGNILRIFSRNGLYLRDATVIETMADTSHIVFDKTGTLTTTAAQSIRFMGEPLSRHQVAAVSSLAAQSNHPLSRALYQHLGKSDERVAGFQEFPGKGIEGFIAGDLYMLGSKTWVTGKPMDPQDGTRLYVACEHQCLGYFVIENQYRPQLEQLVAAIQPTFRTSILSGDHPLEKARLQTLFGHRTTMKFQQMPADKLAYIQDLQAQGEQVMMIGDGLNDAGALKQADIGISITDNTNNFTPASKAILEAVKLPLLHRFIQLAKANRQIVIASFVMSIVYNIVGLFFAMQGTLSPMIAAILMPASSLSIILLTYGTSKLVAKWLNL